MSEDFSFDELLNQSFAAFKEAENQVGRCNVLVIGKTGVGKSTLINAVFRDRLAETGVGRPVTQGIRQYTKPNCPITVYDTPGLELNAEQIKIVQLNVAKLIDDQRLLPPIEHIHVIWYCINHGTNRIEPVEENWLKEIEIKDVPVILVLTQTTTKKPSEFFKELEHLNLPVSQIIPVLAEPEEIDDDYTVKSHSLDRLVDYTFQLLPEVAKKAFVKEQIASIDLKADMAFKYVTGYVAGSAVIGATPIPFADAPILVTVQTAMIANITVIFGLPFNKGFISTMFSTITGASGVTAVGRTIVANLLKMIPGAGTLVGGAISGATAATLTLALGLAYIEVLKNYIKAQINGEKISLPELSKMFLELYKDYVQSGRKTLREDKPIPPKNINIE
ncbi:MAG TPA: GTPase [Kamptonema sp.]|nr:GTPase [Kamptonema sp.]